MSLAQLDLVAVGVGDERDAHRPLLQAHRRDDRGVAGVDGRLMRRLDVVGVDVQLPERRTHLDGTVLSELLCELQLGALAVGALDDGLAGLLDVGAAGALQTERLVEGHRSHRGR